MVRRIPALHYNPDPADYHHPSWLSLMGNMKDSLWSIDLFRCESMTLNSYWVLESVIDRVFVIEKRIAILDFPMWFLTIPFVLSVDITEKHC